MIPCSCKECKKQSTPFYFNYNNILKAKEKGKQQAQCQTSFEEIPIVDAAPVLGVHAGPGTAGFAFIGYDF